jgi:hypothetical protein
MVRRGNITASFEDPKMSESPWPIRGDIDLISQFGRQLEPA